MHTIKKKKGFLGNNIWLNLVAIIVTGVLLIILTLFLLKIYTRHGQDVNVPDVTGLQVNEAAAILKSKGLQYSVVDSIYKKNAIPGAIIEQIPEATSKIKEGRSIFLVIYSQNPQQIAVPGLVDYSSRQAEAMLNSMGFNQVRIQEVPSEYAGLVIAVEYHGRTLRAEEKVPIGSPLTLVVGSGQVIDSLDINKEYIVPPSEVGKARNSESTEDSNLEDAFF